MDVFVLALALAVVFILVVLDLVRRKRLKEKYSLLWLLVGAVMLTLASSRQLLESAANRLHVYYAPSLLFLCGLIFSFALILHVTVVLSRLEDRVVRLAQEVALLRAEQKETESGEQATATCGERNGK